MYGGRIVFLLSYIGPLHLGRLEREKKYHPPTSLNVCRGQKQRLTSRHKVLAKLIDGKTGYRIRVTSRIVNHFTYTYKHTYAHSL